ncbi:arginase [Undibacterium sp. CY18W]|uniref:Arginase n=1 Tax=Undibacterium hunanense TaxID=2762292 RepID=A0ABR6ZQ68_9BURK|nr:arginase [Undibacterium hunanense]MBC3918052.1 arginase [Undibacterium hunanense]
MKTISLIGAPTDVGASVRGAGMGPDALRVAGLNEALTARGLKVIDHGNLHGPANPWEQPVNGLRHLKEAIDWNQAVYDAVDQALRDGHMPMMLGGDHCLAIGSISAVAAHCRRVGKKLRVLWFDAHADSNLSTISPTGNIHGMPVACLMGHGPKELINYAGHTPAIQATDIRLIGIRSVDDGERRFIHEMGMQVFDMRYIDEYGMRNVMSSALANLDSNTHLHVSFDLDCLDPGIAPGVGTAVLGGPSYREAQLCMEMVADTGLMASLDVVELNPALDIRNQTAVLAVDLIESLFGKSTLVRM